MGEGRIPIFSTSVGTITALSRSAAVIVRLDDGREFACRGLRRLHRTLGFFDVPIGGRVRIRFDETNPGRPPLILDVLPASLPESPEPAGH